LLFVVGDGGDDGLTRNAERLAAIFGADGSDPFVSVRTPAGVSRKFYTRGQLEMARDDTGLEKLAIVPGDVSTKWVELEDDTIVCRDRDTDEIYLQFEGPENYRQRDPSDAPATVHYDLEDTNYVVERGDKIERKYGAKGPLTDEWTYIYEPVIPEAMFREHGHDSVPEPDAFRIAIVPNDDRDLKDDPELLMFDVGSEAAVPIEAWLDGSTDPVETIDLEPGARDDGGGDSPDAKPLREPEAPVSEPEAPEPQPDSERQSEEQVGDDNDDENNGIGASWTDV
jgi:hypothetical protein